MGNGGGLVTSASRGGEAHGGADEPHGDRGLAGEQDGLVDNPRITTSAGRVLLNGDVG